MVNVLVRDVSPDVHAALLKRAAANGMSLQQFLLAELARLAHRPTMAEWIERVERRIAQSTPIEDDLSAADYVRAAREERTAQILGAVKRRDQGEDREGGEQVPRACELRANVTP